MWFAERMGYRPVEEQLQIESIDDALRNSLWNLVCHYWLTDENCDYHRPPHSTSYQRAVRVFETYFKLAVDRLPSGFTQYYELIRQVFFESEWYDVYGFLEYVLADMEHHGLRSGKAKNELQAILEENKAGYRFLGGHLCPIVSSEEISSIVEATRGKETNPASAHLAEALLKLSDRNSPDYRNSIKESISAVEAIAKKITGDNKATLGDALRVLETKGHMKIHPALRTALDKLYGYTSDSGGIRHSLTEGDDEPEFDEAKLMLVLCSAFVNFMTSKAASGHHGKELTA